MGVWTDNPIQSEHEAESVRWAMDLCQRYIERPSTLLPASIVESIKDGCKKRIVSYRKQLAKWEGTRFK